MIVNREWSMVNGRSNFDPNSKLCTLNSLTHNSTLIILPLNEFSITPFRGKGQLQVPKINRGFLHLPILFLSTTLLLGEFFKNSPLGVKYNFNHHENNRGYLRHWRRHHGKWHCACIRPTWF